MAYWNSYEYREQRILRLAKEGKDAYEIRYELFSHREFPPALNHIRYILRKAGLSKQEE